MVLSALFISTYYESTKSTPIANLSQAGCQLAVKRIAWHSGCLGVSLYVRAALCRGPAFVVIHGAVDEVQCVA